MLQPESTLKTKYANEAENWTQRLNQDLDDEIAQVQMNKQREVNQEPVIQQIEQIDPRKLSVDLLPRLKVNE